MRTQLLAASAVLLIASVAWADVESGPKVGDPVSPLKVFAVVGKLTDKEVDYAAERKDEPTIYLLVNAARFGRPAARFMKVLDEKLGDAPPNTYVVAVWVTDDVEKSKKYLPLAQSSIKFSNTALTVCGSPTGPDLWSVNADADVTVVVANRGKVVAKYGYVSVNDTLVAPVLEALKKSAQ